MLILLFVFAMKGIEETVLLAHVRILNINGPSGQMRSINYLKSVFSRTLCRANKAQSTASLTAKSRGREFDPQPYHITFGEIDHEIIPTAVLPLLLIRNRIMDYMYFIVDKNRTVVSYWRKYGFRELITIIWARSCENEIRAV